jgi:hypothetical protein
MEEKIPHGSSRIKERNLSKIAHKTGLDVAFC